MEGHTGYMWKGHFLGFAIKPQSCPIISALQGANLHPNQKRPGLGAGINNDLHTLNI